MRSVALAGVFVAALTAAATAHAADDITTLEAQLGRETTELSTSDCAAACKALASIRRAAARICELEPGPRCSAAREKADAAGKRVREACPECAIATLPGLEQPREERATTPEARPAAAPAGVQESEARGGCRSCSTVPRGPGGGDLLVFAAIALCLRRRNKQV